MRKIIHLEDQELLLAADGEISARGGAKVRRHLAECEECRARMAGIEETLLNLQESHREILDGELEPARGPRAILRARLSELAGRKTQTSSWWRFLQLAPVMQVAAGIGVICFIGVMGLRMLFPPATPRDAKAASVAFERAAIPNRSLTPGAARSVSLGEVCSMAHEEVERDVPDSLRRRVFQEYGIANARAGEYEIDYLIAPGLGGTEDIHNLWPEPYTFQAWNAHVKDSLEEHLHQLVCAGKVDLRTAQKDISTDWIAAYKKYFHTDRPVDGRVVSVGAGAGWFEVRLRPKIWSLGDRAGRGPRLRDPPLQLRHSLRRAYCLS